MEKSGSGRGAVVDACIRRVTCLGREVGICLEWEGQGEEVGLERACCSALGGSPEMD